MTIRDTNSNNNNKSFASAAPTTETDAVAFNVNTDDDIFNADNNIPFAHASSLSTTTTTAANNSGLYGQLNNNAGATSTTNAAHAAGHTPIAYSTGKPPHPPRSLSVAVATGAPTPTPTPTPTPIYATHTTRYNNNSSECCTRWNTCGGITCIVLSCFFIGCCLPIFLSIIMTIGFAANYDYDYDDDSYNNMAVVDDYYTSNFDITNNNFTIGNNNFTIGNNNFTIENF